jgi:hypothetical protein
MSQKFGLFHQLDGPNLIIRANIHEPSIARLNGSIASTTSP